MHAQVPPPGTTSNALVVKELISKFEELGRDVIDRCGRKFKENIQRTLPEKEKAFIDYLSSKYSKMVENTNKDIQEINTELGLNLPLQKPKEISASHVEENNLKFITAERERNAIQKEHLKNNFDEFNLEVTTILEISATETISSLTLPTESPDDKATIAQTVIKLEAEKEQDKTAIAKWQSLYNEVRQENTTFKERMKQLNANIQYYKVVANSCSLVRQGYHNSGHSFRDDGGFHGIKGRPLAVKKVNDVRNNACHQGDVETDFALFIIDPNRASWNIGGERYKDFTNSYGVTPDKWAKIISLSKASPDPVLVEVLNMHSTMHRCYSNMEFTHSPKNDETFNGLFEKLFKICKDMLATANSSLSTKIYENLVFIVKQAKNDRSAMRRIVWETVKCEKARCSKRSRLISP
ncbi:uncharacterized protein EAE97_010570 [Botrytis byssoidea]|uniref:Uncharacterized protein n=1 Tax=Botrytis byssoidea TaxID=139641 RepID=A0A9P5LT22_9HELO|nr:uncharacterized protein EAE97_010570 [Botrytis byssoidea]KAF7924619.1 hypothetical protein EAE97_010570 [Botrytis byssoidea]